MITATTGCAKIAEFLIKHGAQVDKYCSPHYTTYYSDQDSIITGISDHQKTALFFAIECNKTAVAEVLLKHDADVNFLDPAGETPLIFAMRYDCQDIAELLLTEYRKKIKNIDHANNDGETALMMAAERGSDSHILQLLIKLDADILKKNTAGLTAKDLAIASREKWNLEEYSEDEIPEIDTTIELLQDAERTSGLRKR
jgi:ankyrin repeat protein